MNNNPDETAARPAKLRHRENETRLPVLCAAERMRQNAVLLQNLGEARAKILKEKSHAAETANTAKNAAGQVGSLAPSPQGG